MTLSVAVTGAGGFVGSALSRRLAAEGAIVHAYSRTPVDLACAHWHRYNLCDPGGVGRLPEGVTTVVHAAFKLHGSRAAIEDLNCRAAAAVRDAARRRGAHLVFISSMSAHERAASSYGRAKLCIEGLLDPSTDAIVRPGLVIGPGGVYARMLEMMRRTPVLPIFYGGSQPVQPIGIADLVEALWRIVRGRLAGVFNLGVTDPLTILALYRRMLAAAGLRRPLVPVPGGLTLHALRMLEWAGVQLPLTSENLLGLRALRRFETDDSLARLGLSLAPIGELPWVGVG